MQLNDTINNVTELNNNDLVIFNEHKIYIYNLINDKYILYQTLMNMNKEQI